MDSVHRFDTSVGFWRKVDDEVVVLMRHSTSYFGVNDSGTVLWDLILAGATTQALADRLVERFELEPDVALADAAEFVEALREKGLLLG